MKRNMMEKWGPGWGHNDTKPKCKTKVMTRDEMRLGIVFRRSKLRPDGFRQNVFRQNDLMQNDKMK